MTASGECAWLNARMEAFFSLDLPDEERRRAERHMDACDACRSEVAALRAIDPLMRELIEFRTARAVRPAPRRVHMSRVFASAAALAAAAAIVLALWSPRTPVTPNSVATAPPAATIEKTPLAPDSPENDLGKPQPPAIGPAPSATAGEPGDSRRADAPAFVVADVAGYERTLADYRGETLLVGVLSARQPQAGENLERINRALGTRVRLVAVSNVRPAQGPKNATFQILYNRGSKLLGAQESEYLLVNSTGDIVDRGSLLGDSSAILRTLRGELKNLENR